MSHLNDPTLNAYLDSDLDPPARREADSHLATCPACATRLNALSLLFAELESLPDLSLQRDLSRSVMAALQPKRPPISQPTLSPAARLAFAVQALVALGAVAIALPLALQLTATLDLTANVNFQLPFETPNFQSLTSNLQSLTSDFQLLISNLQSPISYLQLPAFEITTLILSVVALTALWFVGNGLLLRLNSQTQRLPKS